MNKERLDESEYSKAYKRELVTQEALRIEHSDHSDAAKEVANQAAVKMLSEIKPKEE